MFKAVKKFHGVALASALMTSAAIGGGGGGGSAPAFVQRKMGLNGSSDTTSIPCTLDAVVGNGNGLIVVAHSAGDGTSTPDTCTVTDDKGNTYTLVDSHQNSPASYCTYTFYCTNITNAPQTITATLNISRQFGAIAIAEFTNLKAASPLDGHAIASTNGNESPDGISSGSITPTTDGDLIFGYAVDATSNGIVAITTGFTAGFAASNTWYSEYKVQTTAAAVAALFTGADAGVRVTATVLAFKRK